jgi:DNA replication protein DnaC
MTTPDTKRTLQTTSIGSAIVDALKPANIGPSNSTKMTLAGEEFFLAPDFARYVRPADVYRVLEYMYTTKTKKTATAANFKNFGNEAYNPFESLEQYKAHMAPIIEARARAADFELKVYDFQKEYLHELHAYFGGFHDQLQYLDPTKKIIVVAGGFGLGKTFFLRCFASNPYQSFHFARAKELEELVKNGGFDQFQSTAYNWIRPTSTAEYYRQTRLALFVDDIGTEETEAKSYGNVNNVVQMIIEHRYEKMRYQGNMHLILSTNNNIGELKAKYGDRVYDRLMETATFFIMPDHPSLRVTK